ncbi:hypothetical protein LSTR_LSTR013350 [Laodelphax striatellus]|uniref:Ribosomal protein L7Ae/L30e/S12e/Gadd45 domain-containing protein n=1 Tax=Laodelphax striatellus TaxID=195883 RepID=A0A482XBU7_LAOST|nr:hypothetical protein LSTR_LSTR013350 [Laodelphax striatellus]
MALVYCERSCDIPDRQRLEAETPDVENRRIGKEVAAVLNGAIKEKRAICGLLAAIRQLELDPFRIACCLLPQHPGADRASHIHTILLQAFCYEQNIAIIQVDSQEKLKHYTSETDCSCVLILQPWSKEKDTLAEKQLLKRIRDFSTLHSIQPIFKLPAT